ncbi:MAG: hypothetical protein Q8R60_11650 [Mycobacteriales bacterium]|nr:hypothetical protein [Mycobacteriales bacterium]
MARAVHAPHVPHVSSDRLLAALSLGLGLVAIAMTAAEAWDAALWIGLAAVFVSGWSQMVSETTRERFESIFGLTLGGLALWIGLNSGGYFY